MNNPENSTPPIELANERIRNSYVAGSMSDGRKLGLAVGSGGMAGTVTLGMLKTIEEAGVTRVCDSLYGISVGGINTAALASGRINEGVETFEELASNAFMGRKHLLRGKFINMGLLNQIVESRIGPVVKEIQRFPIPVKVGVTRLSGGITPLTINLSIIDPNEVVPFLTRGAHLPIAGGPAPKDSAGIAYADGGMSHLSVIDMAMRDGCSDVLFLSNQPYAPEKFERLQVMAAGLWMSFYDKLALRRFPNIVREQISSRQPFREGSFTYQSSRITAFYPKQPANQKDRLPELYTMDKGRLRMGFDLAAEMMKQMIGPVFNLQT